MPKKSPAAPERPTLATYAERQVSDQFRGLARWLYERPQVFLEVEEAVRSRRYSHRIIIGYLQEVHGCPIHAAGSLYHLDLKRLRAALGLPPLPEDPGLQGPDESAGEVW